ncbi:hypothetical protein [Rheinheimera sp.]|uniref:hypothetical protein n=1 Tax=Rheinheimera sp. TaxID=1869214 RepID=UPI0027BA0370|nr:hypothetical protein [Rheinheimera sp.]
MNKLLLVIALSTVTCFAPVTLAVAPETPEVPAEQNQQPPLEPNVEADCKYVVPHCDSM